MDEDEVGTLASLKTHLAEVFGPETARRGGRILKPMGDGALVEFAPPTPNGVSTQRTQAPAG